MLKLLPILPFAAFLTLVSCSGGKDPVDPSVSQKSEQGLFRNG